MKARNLPQNFNTAASRSGSQSEIFCQAVELALEAELPSFSLLNLTSEIEGSPWDISATKEALGYVPRDRHVPQRSPLSARLISYIKRQSRPV